MSDNMPDDSFPRIFVKTDLSNDPPGMATIRSEYPDLPKALGEIGVDGVEIAIRGISGELDRNKTMLETFEDEAALWLDAGKIVHPHPYTAGDANPAAFTPPSDGTVRRAFEQVVTTAKRLNRSNDEPLGLTYHPGTATGDDQPDRDELVARSRQFFAMVDDVLNDFDNRLRVVAETQLPASRDSDTTRIGDVPNESIVMATDRQSVGVCWDTGHYILSSERLDSPAFPPTPLIQQVEHIHLHDVRDDTDHQPPEPGDDRLSDAIEAAVATGNVRSVTLEYDYAKAVDERDDVDVMLNHIEEAIEWIREVSTATTTATVPDHG